MLIAVSLLTLVATFYMMEREKTDYFAKLLALLTFACYEVTLAKASSMNPELLQSAHFKEILDL